MSGLLSGLMSEERMTSNSQDVRLTGRETPHTLYSPSVNIHPSQASELDSGAAGSSKVKITTVTNQNWDLPRGGGTIVASNDQFLAYVLEGKSGYVLRLIQPETSNRALLKGFVGAVLDVSFAHRGSGLLACVDEGGNVYIWDLDKVDEVSKAPSDALRVGIQRGREIDGLPHRLVWNPPVGVAEEEEETVIVSHGREIEVIDVHAVMKTVPSGMKLPRKSIEQGIVTIPGIHSQNVCDMSLSPDGQVLASCGGDGLLKFWSLAEERCLHELKAHNGCPVTRLMFCDDHLSQDPSNQFWRFLLTAADSNREVKLWCTVQWQCLQTIRFCSPSSGPDPHILLNLDLSASYLIATDVKRMAVYVIQLSVNGDRGFASLTSVTEYLLKQPIYSFVVLTPTPVSNGNAGGASSGSDSDEEASPVQRADFRLTTVGIKLHTVHSRSMQELEIRFDPPDISGIPPSSHAPLDTNSPDVSGVLPPSHAPLDTHSPDVSGMLLPSHAPLDTQQPSSLPALTDDDLMTSSSPFHSLTDTGSPKLLTPSQFLASTKSDGQHHLHSPREFETMSSLQPSFTSVTMETVSPSKAAINSLSGEGTGPLLTLTVQETVSRENSVEKELNKTSETERLIEIEPDNSTVKPLEDSPAHPQATSTFEEVPVKTGGADDETMPPTSTMDTPPEIPARNTIGEGNSLAQEEEAWPDIEGPLLPKTSVSNVYNSPVVRSGVGGLVREEGRLVSDVMPPAIDDVPPVGGRTGTPVTTDELSALPVNEEVLSIADDSPPPPIDSEAPVDLQELVMPSANDTEVALEILNTSNLQSGERSHDQSSERSHDQSGERSHDQSSDMSHDQSGERSHDQSGDMSLPDLPDAVTSTEAAPQVKGQADSVGPQEKSQSDERGVAAVEIVQPTLVVHADIVALVAKQQEEINRLRTEQGQLVERLERKLEEMQTVLLQTQASTLQEHARQHDERLERLLREKQSSDKTKQALTNAVTVAVKNKLDHLVKAEMKNLVLPALKHSMESFQGETMTIMSQSVMAMDTQVREGISQVLHTRGLSEVIGNAVAGSLQRVMVSRYEEAFKSTVLPGFEKACQEMFRQIDEAFRRGTTEYLGQLSQHNRQMADVILQQVTQSLNSLVAGGQGSPLGAQIQSSMQHEMATLLQNIQRVVVDCVTSTVTKEVQKAFEENSPAAKEEEEKKRKEEEIGRLANEQQYNSAFELALSTSDLKLVMFLCAKVNPDLVFDKTPCPFSQPVLLSLIQQLSVDLQDQLELKIKYLEHSLLALDVSSDVTRSHMAPVVSQLSQKLAALEQTKLVKRLNMMARHLVGQ